MSKAQIIKPTTIINWNFDELKLKIEGQKKELETLQQKQKEQDNIILTLESKLTEHIVSYLEHLKNYEQAQCIDEEIEENNNTPRSFTINNVQQEINNLNIIVQNLQNDLKKLLIEKQVKTIPRLKIVGKKNN